MFTQILVEKTLTDTFIVHISKWTHALTYFPQAEDGAFFGTGFGNWWKKIVPLSFLPKSRRSVSFDSKIPIIQCITDLDWVVNKYKVRFWQICWLQFATSPQN